MDSLVDLYSFWCSVSEDVDDFANKFSTSMDLVNKRFKKSVVNLLSYKRFSEYVNIDRKIKIYYAHFIVEVYSEKILRDDGKRKRPDLILTKRPDLMLTKLASNIFNSIYIDFTSLHLPNNELIFKNGIPYHRNEETILCLETRKTKKEILSLL